MSSQFSSAMIFVFVVFIALAANRAEQNESVSPRATGGRGPASVTELKEMRLGELQPSVILNHTEKVHGSVSVHVEMVGPKPAQVGDTFVLRGTITADDESLAHVGYKWSLPKGVRLVQGEARGQIASIPAGQSVTRELTLQKTSQENVKVHLLAAAHHGTTRFAESAQFNTDVQDQLDAERAQRRQALESQSTDGAKIVH